MTIRPYTQAIGFTLCLLLSQLASQLALASTILQVDIDYLLSKSALIFEGQVLSKQSQWNDSRSGIITLVTFRVDEIIKGEHAKSTLTLQFSGGVVGNEGMRVSSMVYPEIGEKGIYFVEELSRNLVNPLVGWSQGHFLIEPDEDGTEKILTEDHSPVLGFTHNNAAAPSARQIQNQSENQSENQSQSISTPSDSNKANPNQTTDQPFSEGKVKGIRTGEKNGNKKQALDKAAFKIALKHQLQNK